MRIIIPLFVAATALAPAGRAAAADRNFTVTDFDRIRLDGPFRVSVRTGVAPFARASGSLEALDKVAIEVQGRTLVVRPNRSSWGGYPGKPAGPVTIEVGTHDLSASWVNGAGSLLIDRARGLRFDVTVQGAGTVRIDRVEADRLSVGLNGAASATLGGRADKLTAIVRGVSSLDSAALQAKDVVVGTEGASVIRVAASHTAQINAAGTASVSVDGGAACTVKIAGSASVSGC